MAKQRSTAYTVGQPLTQFAPQPILATRAPTSSDTNYELGRVWIDTAGDAAYVLVDVSAGVATWALSSPGDSDVDSFDTDSGAVTPTLGVVDIVGGTGITTSGSGNTITITGAGGGASVSPYVVAADGSGDYTTVQAALTAANGAGGGIVVLRPGTYTEDLTLYDNTQVVGAIGMGDTGDFVVVGTHAPPTTGGFVFRNVRLTDATAIFNSAAAGSATILLSDVQVGVTNGYCFDLANWTGTIACWDTDPSLGTNDGFINNTGGATVIMYSAGMGIGTGNGATITGATILQSAQIGCPLTFDTGATSVTIDDCQFEEAVVLDGDSAGSINCSRFTTGASAAITMSSSADWKLDLLSIDSSNSPAIDGAGAGTLTYGLISFLNNSEFAATLTLSRQEMSSGTVFATTFDTDVAAAACTLSGTTLAVDGTDANIGFTLTTKGTGTLALANGTAGVAVEVANGINTVAQTVTVAGGAAAADSTVNIMTGIATAGTQTVNIASAASATAVNMGTGAAAKTVTIGSTNTTSTTTINAGSGGVQVAGDVDLATGSLQIEGAGQRLAVEGGAATDFIGTATLSSGTVTVAHSTITAADRVFLCRSDLNSSTEAGVLEAVVTASTNFVINSRDPSDATIADNDNSIVSYFIVRQL